MGLIWPPLYVLSTISNFYFLAGASVSETYFSYLFFHSKLMKIWKYTTLRICRPGYKIWSDCFSNKMGADIFMAFYVHPWPNINGNKTPPSDRRSWKEKQIARYFIWYYESVDSDFRYFNFAIFQNRKLFLAMNNFD